jgi:hypothetical protein
MAKTLVGVLAVSMAALLFAGCGGSGLSPAQQEVCDQLNAKKKELEANIESRDWKTRSWAEKSLPSNLKQRAEAGC